MGLSPRAVGRVPAFGVRPASRWQLRLDQREQRVALERRASKVICRSADVHTLEQRRGRRVKDRRFRAAAEKVFPRASVPHVIENVALLAHGQLYDLNRRSCRCHARSDLRAMLAAGSVVVSVDVNGVEAGEGLGITRLPLPRAEWVARGQQAPLLSDHIGLALAFEQVHWLGCVGRD